MQVLKVSQSAENAAVVPAAVVVVQATDVLAVATAVHKANARAVATAVLEEEAAMIADAAMTALDAMVGTTVVVVAANAKIGDRIMIAHRCMNCSISKSFQSRKAWKPSVVRSR
jgi:hypothetical protein